ncbi:vitamin-D-receptor interacting mediator subunit 4-domain-containing protein [Hyaloraphidium curvatum]|nr:vitamin-D-receptor interacting mediator subunit 4-domain-containing protein [Hyaloraphidium curvatum]
MDAEAAQTVDDHYRLAEALRVANDLIAERRAGVAAVGALQARIDALDSGPEASPERAELQREMEFVRGKTEGYAVAVIALVRKLEQAESKLEAVLRATKQKVDDVRQAQSEPLDYKTLLAHARRITPYTSAPPDVAAAHPLAFSRPPIPVDGEIRRSILMQIQLAGGQLPEVSAPVHEKPVEEVKPEHHAPVEILRPQEPTQSVFDLDL